MDNTDCNDLDNTIFPGATEICDGIDQNCDGDADGGFSSLALYYLDNDIDGYGVSDPATDTLSCGPPAGYTSQLLDCDDLDAQVNPLAIEICNGIDDNCDLNIDEGFDDDPIEEGWGVFNSLKILTQINPFVQQTKFQYNIYIETDPEEAINYTDSIQGGNSISNLKILHTWFDMMQPAYNYYSN